MITKHVWVCVRAISVTALLVNLSACAVSDEVDNQTIELADKLAVNGGETSTPANPTSNPEPDEAEPTPTGKPSANPTTTNPTSTPGDDEPSAEGGAGAMPGGGGSGGAGGPAGMGGADAMGGADGTGGAGGGPLMPEGDPPASMNWETCEPIWATHFCPELDCETTARCTGEQAQYETDCRTWCSAMMECVSANPDCVEEADPLCISSYSPRDKCIDYIDSENPKSAGAGTQTNYAGSWGSRAAIALLECACGTAN